MTSITQLDPVFAETGDKGTILDAKYETGWVDGDQPGSDIFNTAQNRADLKINEIMNWTAAQSVGNFSAAQIPAGITAMEILGYHPSIGEGRWLVGSTTGSPENTYYSDNNGASWSGSTSLGDDFTDEGKGSVDSTRFLVLSKSATTTILYSTNATSWSNTTAPDSAGATGSSVNIDTKTRVSDDFIVVGTGTGKIGFADSVTDSWSVPSVSPSSSDPIFPIFLTGTTFFAVDETGLSFISTDDCDNWAATATNPASISGTVINTWSRPSYNPNTGTICVSGTDTGSNVFEINRTTDSGTTWAKADVSNTVRTSQGKANWVGGNTWICNGSEHIFTSHDDGETWHEGIINDYDASSSSIGHVYSNGEILMFANNDEIYVSQPVPNLSNL